MIEITSVKRAQAHTVLGRACGTLHEPCILRLQNDHVCTNRAFFFLQNARSVHSAFTEWARLHEACILSLQNSCSRKQGEAGKATLEETESNGRAWVNGGQ